ncbi:MAG: carbamoyltransferase HypF [Gemmatimonadaceae bacterium]|nr:carbamoyltransferase HypF [Gemmatimonadaceae bacterium]
MSELSAQSFRIRGVVQGVGFRPFVFRIAREHDLTGWVLNDADGVRIHAEGRRESLAAFARDLVACAPDAAGIDAVEVTGAKPGPFTTFIIANSERGFGPTAGISPDLPACAECLAEMLEPSNRRAGYAYVNCAACGPRFSIVEGLPYDRSSTTMREWPMCEACSGEFHDPEDRRFHAQPVACPYCGPDYQLHDGATTIARGRDAIRDVAPMLTSGLIVAIKGIGGYHLACDAGNASAVATLRERKFRKEQPFAVMVRNGEAARRTIELTQKAEDLLCSSARPIVLGHALVNLAGVAPDTSELGVMLPYTPLHSLLFAEGAPDRLVMTSANRSSEPIAYRDDDALRQLAGIADVFLIGERRIARRVDDSVARIGAGGLCLLRRSRGYAPRRVARMNLDAPTLALGADMKNTVTLVVNGEAVMSQHIGDLSHLGAAEAFRETIDDLISMYGVNRDSLCVVHDLHPEYFSAAHALDLRCGRRLAVQHHRAHIASVLAERGAFDEPVVGAAFDGTGFGDDGTIWGGEFFVGSIVRGLDRVGHLRSARIPGGDAAARFPVQAAAGLIAEAGVGDDIDLTREPFFFPDRYAQARALLERDIRCFASTSAGRLFDAVAALLGFVRESSYEGQAPTWLESLARRGRATVRMDMPFANGELDFRPALLAVMEFRKEGIADADIARAFHRGLAVGIANGLETIASAHSVRTAVLSGGVFQNDMLLSDVLEFLAPSGMRVWTNNVVPPNDGGISLGQAAMTMAFK